MNLNAHEHLVSRTRLHWGVIALPTLVALLPLLPMVALQWMLGVVLRPLVGDRVPSFLPLMGAVVLLVAVVVVGLAIMAYRRSEVLLTSERLCWQAGLFFRISGELPLRHVEAMFLIEPLLGRLLGYGAVAVVGTGGTRFPLTFLPKVEGFHRSLQAAVQTVQTEHLRPARSREPFPRVFDESRYQPK